MTQLRRLPALVWASTAVHVALLVLGSLTMPMFEVPDERFHADMVVAAQELKGWPQPGERTFSTAIEVSGRILRAEPKTLGKAIPARPSDAQTADGPCSGRPLPVCDYRPTFEELDGYPITPQTINRASQHPPLYYFTTAGLSSVITSIPPLSNDLPIDRLFWLWRLLTLAAVVPLPVLAALTARELDADIIGTNAAALAPLAVPGFYFRSASMINNDALIALLAATVIVLSLRTARRGPSRMRTMALGLVVGLALLTKGLALALPALPLGAYAIHAWRSRVGLRGPATEVAWFAGISTAVGGWWWGRNLLVHGKLQPLVYDPPSPEPQPLTSAGSWFGEWSIQLFRTFWGGWFVPDSGTLIVILGVVAAASIGLGVLRDRDRPLQVLALAAVPLLLAGVAATSLWRFLTSGVVKASQGRYVYPALVGIAAVSAVGWVWGLRRWAPRCHPGLPIAVIAGAFALQARSYIWLVRSEWGAQGSDLASSFTAMLAWSPATEIVVLVCLAAALLGFVLLQVIAVWAAVKEASGPQ